MIKTSIWCQTCFDFRRETRPEAFEVWSGELPVLLREGDLICLFDGWSGETVKRAFYNVYDNTQIIEIKPDYTGEYREKVKSEQSR